MSYIIKVSILSIVFFLNNPVDKQSRSFQSRIEVVFTKDSWELSDETTSYLDSLVTAITENKDVFTNLNIELTSFHCEQEYTNNRFIGVQRCKVVIDYLREKGNFSPKLFCIKESLGFSVYDCQGHSVLIELAL